MLTSLALVLLFGLLFGYLSQKCSLPPLVGMLFAGVILGGSGLDLLSQELRSISPDLRKMALIIILLKAGLTLKPKEFKGVERPALLMACLPALFEISAFTLLAPLFFPMDHLEGFLLGSVVAAVSPAVVVPNMVALLEQGYGKKKRVPQIILAGASLDDVFVIVLFSSALLFLEGGGFSPQILLDIPISISTGVLFGVTFGFLLSKYGKKIPPLKMVVLLLGLSFLLETLPNFPNFPPFSSLLAVMVMAITLGTLTGFAAPLARHFTGLWSGAEVLLFVLVGAEVRVEYLFSAGGSGLVLLLFALIFRVFGVFFALLGTKLSKEERFFSALSYLPKATVQAAIGGVPLAMGLRCGELVLTIAVLAIVTTAPLGAVAIQKTAPLLLKGDK